MNCKGRVITFLLLGCMIALAGCGPTNQDLVDQFSPGFAEMRTALQRVAGALPASVGGDQGVAQPPDPQPVYKEGAEDIQNTDILMYDYLLDPETELRDQDQLDLRLSNYLRRLLQWTGPESPMSPSVLKKRAQEGLTEEFEQALQIRYLGVARVARYDPPVAVSEEVFTGGYAEVDGFLVDMTTQEVLCAFRITARPNDEVSYTYKEGESKTEALENFAYSTLWTNARTAFVEKMTELCGGQFALRD